MIAGNLVGAARRRRVDALRSVRACSASARGRTRPSSSRVRSPAAARRLRLRRRDGRHPHGARDRAERRLTRSSCASSARRSSGSSPAPCRRCSSTSTARRSIRRSSAARRAARRSRRCRASSPAGGSRPATRATLIDAILAIIEENLSTDMRVLAPERRLRRLAASPGDFDIVLLNSRDHADPFGDPNVSRLVIGGTIPELGIGTIGIAQSIDPGNFADQRDGGRPARSPERPRRRSELAEPVPARRAARRKIDLVARGRRQHRRPRGRALLRQLPHRPVQRARRTSWTRAATCRTPSASAPT